MRGWFLHLGSENRPSGIRALDAHVPCPGRWASKLFSQDAQDPFHHLAAPNQEMKIAKSPNLERNSARYSEWILSYCGLKLCMSSHTPGFVGLCLEAVGPRLGDSKF